MEMNINNSLTITTTPIVVSLERNNNNGVRASIILINTGTEACTISIAQEAQLGKGIVISPGGVWLDSRDAGYLPTQQQITAISATGAAVLAIQERVIL